MTTALPRATRVAPAGVAAAGVGVGVPPAMPRVLRRRRAPARIPIHPPTPMTTRVGAHPRAVAAVVVAAARMRARILMTPSARPCMSASRARVARRPPRSRGRCASKPSASVAARAATPDGAGHRSSQRRNSSHAASRWIASWWCVRPRAARRLPSSKTASSWSTTSIGAAPTPWWAMSTSAACRTSCRRWRPHSSTSAADAMPCSMPARSTGMPPVSRASHVASRWR